MVKSGDMGVTNRGIWSWSTVWYGQLNMEVWEHLVNMGAINASHGCGQLHNMYSHLMQHTTQLCW